MKNAWSTASPIRQASGDAEIRRNALHGQGMTSADGAVAGGLPVTLNRLYSTVRVITFRVVARAAAHSLQSIVAASFDQNESVFLEATAGLKFKLIRWEGKVIQPLVEG